ncbi:hypothetical protein Bca52824_068066 [Brassica carinata]|uniref:Transcription repressor n=1 Tax=Brassica carinata TaxID=52824 RepID=A0A8X7U039_BRACI|nr:hypothetical protein Bca52824_068066 [Brassica carinata]
MRWGRKKPVSSSSGLSRAHHVSWFSKLSGSSDLKPAKEKKQEDEASQKMSAKSSLSSTKRQNESSKRLSAEKEKAATKSANMESNEKYEEIMNSVRKKVRDFQRETRSFQEVEAMDRYKETVIMTPRTQVNRDRQQRCERRDQKLLEQKKPKRPEQDAEVKMKKPAIRTGTETKPAHQWQHLKETKLREVRLKADKQRKSMYLRRELGTKENSKVRVFSPRSSEKCRVKAIEDLKKAKLRAREQELVIATEEDGGMENESFAVVKCSSDPRKDFRDSMIEMIMENGINQPEELKELLVCYLRLNSDEYHDMIINVFQQPAKNSWITLSTSIMLHPSFLHTLAALIFLLTSFIPSYLPLEAYKFDIWAQPEVSPGYQFQ